MTLLKQYGFMIFLFALIGYFFIHAMVGKHSFYHWVTAKKEEKVLIKEFARVSKEEKKLEVHVESLQPESLDLDFLEERARKILNLANPYDYYMSYDTLSLENGQ